MIAAYREPTARRPRPDVQPHRIHQPRVPAALTEIITLGRTLKKRAADVLAYFDRPGTSNGPQRRSTAASNTYAARPWLSQPDQLHCQIPAGTGGFRPRLHPQL